MLLVASRAKPGPIVEQSDAHASAPLKFQFGGVHACQGWLTINTVNHGFECNISQVVSGTVVIDYETFCKIHDCHHRQGLTIAQTAPPSGFIGCGAHAAARADGTLG
jgi:hypothetical protein